MMIEKCLKRCRWNREQTALCWPATFFQKISKFFINFVPCHDKTCLPVSNQVQHKPGCTATKNGKRLEISDLGIRGVAKTKVQIMSAVW